MVYYNITVFLTFYIVFMAGILYITKKPTHLNQPKKSIGNIVC